MVKVKVKVKMKMLVPNKGIISLLGMIILTSVIVFTKTPEVNTQADEQAFNISTVGDISCVSDTISAIEQHPNNLVLFLGDLVYSDDMRCFFDMTKELEERVESHLIAVIGNHDINEDDGNEKTKRQLKEKYHIPDSGYYSISFDNGNILIVVMNYTGLEKGKEEEYLLKDSSQYKFVKESLEDSTSRVKIVASHAPFMACECEGHQPLRGVYRVYDPLFQDADVSLVLSGHNHNYQRYEIGNVTYLTNGLGGRSIYDVPENYDDENLERIFDTDFGYGFSQFTIKKDIIESKFVSTTGQETDRFVINLPDK